MLNNQSDVNQKPPDLFLPASAEEIQHRKDILAKDRSSKYYVPTGWEAFLCRWIWDTRRRSRFSDVDDMLFDLEREALLQKVYYKIKYTIKAMLEGPGDFIRDCKHWKQRACRGWSDRDVWGFQDYLATVIVGGLGHLKKHKWGVPSSCFKNPAADHTDQEMAEAQAVWNNKLDHIIWTFETAKRIQDHDLVYPGEEADYFTEEEEARLTNLCERCNARTRSVNIAMRLMTREEVQKYREGWKVFQKHYSDLWD